MKRSLVLLVFLCSLALFAQEFTLKFDIKGGHVLDLTIGCKANATTDYDKGLDMYVPPQGMAAGFVGIDTNKPDGLYLYRDYRPVQFPQTWRIFGAPKRNMVISWNPKDLPKDLTVTMKIGKNGKTIDMAATSTATLTAKASVFITAEKAAK